MNTEEDEAFDDLAKRQGAWGGGFPAKRRMAADKVQEPVAWRWGIKKLNGGYEWRYALHKTQDDSVPLYAAPPKREWVGLTLDEIEELFQSAAGADEETDIRFARLIEAKLKEKNT
jgi:hypothetical protein